MNSFLGKIIARFIMAFTAPLLAALAAAGQPHLDKPQMHPENFPHINNQTIIQERL